MHALKHALLTFHCTGNLKTVYLLIPCITMKLKLSALFFYLNHYFLPLLQSKNDTYYRHHSYTKTREKLLFWLWHLFSPAILLSFYLLILLLPLTVRKLPFFLSNSFMASCVSFACSLDISSSYSDCEFVAYSPIDRVVSWWYFLIFLNLKCNLFCFSTLNLTTYLKGKVQTFQFS